MARQAVTINAPQAMRARVAGSALNDAAVAKAEEAMKSLSANFDQWLLEEIDKLGQARMAVHRDGLTKVNAEALFLRAHELKTLGATYNFPLVTTLAASLCTLINSDSKRARAPLLLIDSHIQAIKAVVRDGVRDANHPIGLALTTELAKQVREKVGS